MKFAGINYWAVLLAAIAAWLVGAIWYSALRKPWLAALGRDGGRSEAKQGTPVPYGRFALAFFANLIMAWLLAGVMGHFGPGRVIVRNGVISGAFVWLGFVLPTMTVNNAFARRSHLLTAIDAGHWFAALVVIGAIIGWMGVK